MTFRAPVRDLMFTLSKVVGLEQLRAAPAFAELDDETIEAVLLAAADLTDNLLAPLYRTGDRAGATLKDGQVITAPGFPTAFKAFAEGGWVSLAADPDHGGQGLPKALELAVSEMVSGANLAFGLCPILAQGAIEALTLHGTDRQKALYLPRMINGQWTGAMCLTEPQAGSDLAAITTRAEPDGEGGYRLHGQKIFITWGDHDCAENIVHMVLGRLPGAPEGVRGISLFLASKFIAADDGALGERNGFFPAGLEHKLGIHASPTCVMQYEGAQAELVGEAGKGLAHMFVMMNAARLSVGAQGVGVGERAFQQALAYARERRQGRSAWTGQASAPIADHPDVRRMLVEMKADVEAGRALCLLTAVNADLARHGADPAGREAARLREEVLTPIAKAWSTDMGVAVASTALQVHGGMGYIEETGAAQPYRDARITPIYEGTNGVQAIDLAGRKLSLQDGAGMTALIDEALATAAALSARPEPDLAQLGGLLTAGGQALRVATDWLRAHAGSADALAGAGAYLRLAGDVLGGWLLAKGALAAEAPDATLRLALAVRFAQARLTLAPGRVTAVCAGAEGLAAVSPAMLGGD